MRLDLVAAWVLSLPTVSTSPIAEASSASSASVRHTTEAPVYCLPKLKPLRNSQEEPSLDIVNCLPLERVATSFAVPVEEIEEEYQISISVPEERENDECGDIELRLHEPSGQTVDAHTTTAGAIPVLVEVQDSRDRRHSVELYLTSSCASSGTSGDVPDSVNVRGTLLSVDRIRLDKTPVFHVQIETQERRVTSIVGGQSFFNEHEDRQGHSVHHIPDFVESDGVSDRLPRLRDEEIDNTTYRHEREGIEASGLHTDSKQVEEAIRLLEHGETELQQLRDRVEEQRKVVEHLTRVKYTLDSSVLKDCESWGCIIRKFLYKGKACVHGIYIRVVTFVEQSHPPSQTMAFLAAKQTKLSSASVSAEKEHKDDYKYTLLPSIKEDYDSQSELSDEESATSYDGPLTNTTRAAVSSHAAASLDQAATRQSYITTHKIHAALGVFFSLFCFGCLTTLLHRRCCNPRAKADRAARREDMRNRREYAKAARRHAWRDWWAKKMGLGRCLCCGGRREKGTADYEEKRALIMQQEDRLEEHMQEEIRFLTHNATEEGRAGFGSRVSMPSSSRRSMHENSERRSHRHATRQSRANTAGSDSDNAGSLPSYRSRESSSSGRPPSYRTRASSLMQPHLVPGMYQSLETRIANGFPYVGGTARVDWTSDGDDETPDSSVVDVSPRLSSETIRTERSVL